MSVYKKSNSGYLPFIQKEKVTSPYTDIQNRAKVDASLKCVFGTERIHVNSIKKSLNEFGSIGQEVYVSDNEDSRIRFVGNWRTQFNNKGNNILTNNAFSNPNEYIEVTFYGTGLNLLRAASNLATDDINIETIVDGVSQGIINIGDNAIILINRNYKENAITNIVSGLPLGWHTIKIRGAVGSQDFLRVFGVEIVNESSQITVKSGKAHGNGYEYSLDSDQLIDYNLGFDNVLDANIGTKGGRVVTYLDPTDGSIKKRLTKTEENVQYLTNTNHTNESIYRIINFREFGRNRSDDFSTLSTGTEDNLFTLDDGITTLVGDNVSTDVASGNGLRSSSTGSWTITFIGTGLDILRFDTASGGNNTYEVSVDGVLIGNLDSTGVNSERIEKICSGLPYGTHTVNIAVTVVQSTYTLNCRDFIIYQSKKPELPEGAVELADYNLMADFSQGSSIGEDIDSVGVLQKMHSREFSYGGNWTISGINPGLTRGGLDMRPQSNGDYFEYSFFGTGFSFPIRVNSGSANITFTLDGSTDFTGLTVEQTATGTFTVGTGTYTGAINDGHVGVSGLTPGLHTIRVTFNNAGSIVYFNPGIEIITPIHSPHTTFGSLSMKDIRNFDSQKDINKKAKQKETQVKFLESSGVVLFSKGVSQVLVADVGRVNIYFEQEYSGDDNYITSILGQNVDTATMSTEQKKNWVRATQFLSDTNVYTALNPGQVLTKGNLEEDKLEESE